MSLPYSGVCNSLSNSDLSVSFVFAQTKAFSLRRRCPEGADVVKKFRIRRNFHKNGTFSCTPHQSATLTASPQGEAFLAAYLNDKSEFGKLLPALLFVEIRI